MAMNGNQLGSEIAAAVLSPNASPEAQAASIAFYRKLAGAVVAHIVQNAEVPSGITVSTSGGSGATNGPGKVK